MAYGPLGLKPWEFGRLTFGEFQALAEGYQWRKEQEQVLSAGFVASLINTCSTRDLKSAVTVDMLLGRQSAKQQSKTSDQAKADMKALLVEVG